MVLGGVGSHDSIVSVFDVVMDGPLQFVVFEYMGGGTLADYVTKEGPIPLEQLLRLARQVCRGLAHLHNKGLLHRDVCAKNVLLDERGAAHLGDFDSAIWLEDPEEEELPQTPNRYAAPEELRGSRLDYRSDLFSLGCLLYVMAVGKAEVGDVYELRTARPDLPTSFADLVESLLAETPDGRPNDGDQVLLWLNDIRKASNLDALIRAGESQQVEFKSSLTHIYAEIPAPEAEKRLRLALRTEVTKTIAAFLNSDGGILLIGVDDVGHIVGIEPDFSDLTKPSLDAWLLHLRDVSVADIGPDAYSAIRVSLVQHGDVHVAVVSCPKRASATWHGKDGEEVLYVRAGNMTQKLTGLSLETYLREHWPLS